MDTQYKNSAINQFKKKRQSNNYMYVCLLVSPSQNVVHVTPSTFKMGIP